MRWRSHGALLSKIGINYYVYQEKPYDLTALNWRKDDKPCPVWAICPFTANKTHDRQTACQKLRRFGTFVLEIESASACKRIFVPVSKPWAPWMR
jgi:hypothetical protein